MPTHIETAAVNYVNALAEIADFINQHNGDLTISEMRQALTEFCPNHDFDRVEHVPANMNDVIPHARFREFSLCHYVA
jgi:hypothetical protein